MNLLTEFLRKNNTVWSKIRGITVQTEINLYEIACKRHARGLQLACKKLAEGELSEAMEAFKRLVSCLQKACKWLAEAH